MSLFRKIILIVLILMSLAAGAAKVLQMPQEIQFFQTAGLGIVLLMVLGVVQVVGAGLAAVPKTRTIGAGLMGVGFLVSAAVIFMTGNIGFGVFSLLPVALAGFLMTGAREV